MLIRYIFVLVIGLSLLLLSLSYQVAQQRQVLNNQDSQLKFLLQKSRQNIAAQKQRQAAVNFMAEAQSFVNKAKSVGIHEGNINSYKVDFNQVVETGRIPQLLNQSRSANGRIFSPRSLGISRDGMSFNRELKEQVINVKKYRGAAYVLSFAGDVLVVSNEE